MQRDFFGASEQGSHNDPVRRLGSLRLRFVLSEGTKQLQIESLVLSGFGRSETRRIRVVCLQGGLCQSSR